MTTSIFAKCCQIIQPSKVSSLSPVAFAAVVAVVDRTKAKLMELEIIFGFNVDQVLDWRRRKSSQVRVGAKLVEFRQVAASLRLVIINYESLKRTKTTTTTKK